MTELEQAAKRLAAEMDLAFMRSVSPDAVVITPVSVPTTNPASSKREWLDANPDFKHWRPQGVLSMRAWKDVGWVTVDGQFIPQGDDRFYGGLHLDSYGDTLYVVPSGASKVGREYSTTI